jgi:microcystin-dependent protein
MADVTIDQLPNLTPTTNSLIPITNGITTGKATINQVNALVNIPQAVPVGAVFYLATATAPGGYLICDGSTIPNGNGTVQGQTANYSALFAALGSIYGGAGRLPDLRGQFIRGVDRSRGIDSNREFGSNQGSQIKAIPTVNLSTSYGGSNGYTSTRAYWGASSSSNNYPVGASSSQSCDASGPCGGRPGGFNNFNMTGTAGTETRPTNVALLPVIKY